MLTFFEKEVNGYFFVFPIVSCRPKTWLHVSWRVTLVWHLVTFYGPWVSLLQLTRAEVTHSEWTGSVAWLGPSDYTEYNLSQAFRWWSVAQSQRAGRCSSLFSAHISSCRPHNLNSWNSFLRRRLVEDIWLALVCISWPVTLVALFPALDNRGCTVSHANIGKFLLPIVVVLSLPRATNFSKHYKNFPTQSPTAETSRKRR